ncbi:RteC domain-containing protein [Wenyingzhuangia sp. 2_MG-2023]|uniref:RteC domain-containing protein n=1 Tax=Wenyingzhuangia sp. 2_MG-2023 TaxID=3062639 RepID=UPI0026E3AE0B|nr:RteC domain-containing protein [Wenyingzhuangia sp. 2_MG-2023]MDO6739366.1 RteC domain-containing protein [Wenyingzhuangia sp. 2_MG-2023]
MEEINLLMSNYEKELKKINNSNFNQYDLLKQKISVAKKSLHQLRNNVRKKEFNKIEDEIYFFKFIKPKVCGELNFFKNKLNYLLEKPFVSLEKNQKHIQKELRDFETKKKKNLMFYRYMKRGDTIYDDKYFIRNPEQLQLFSSNEFIDSDPEVSTSHDLLAFEVVTYNLITNFYKNELNYLASLEDGMFDTSTNNLSTTPLIWTSSKTDLIELIYALKVTGSINGGDSQIKQLTEIFGQLFSVDLGNYYKTYADIKNRSNDPAKFLNKLVLNLNKKVELDEM